MCFSAQISFVAAALLTGVAALTLRTVQKKEQVPLATIPLIFAVQQFAEGILWVLLPNNSYPPIIDAAKYIFLSIAFIVWPTFIPFSLLAIEKDMLRRYALAFLSVIGIAWSFTSTCYLVTYGATVQIESCHIYYHLIGTLKEDYIQIALYCLTTIISFFTSSTRAIQILGGIIALSFIAASMLYYTYFISVWCFFAAIISLSVYYITRFYLE
jgi:hypothetical protein